MKTSISKVRILIVEDEALIAEDIAIRLTVMNYEIVGVAQGVDQALKLIEQEKTIDLILIDIILKGDKDGVDLANIINASHKLPFIFLTSHSSEKIIDRIKNVKPDAFLLKPFNDRQVGVAIEIALAKYFKKTMNQRP